MVMVRVPTRSESPPDLNLPRLGGSSEHQQGTVQLCYRSADLSAETEELGDGLGVGGAAVDGRDKEKARRLVLCSEIISMKTLSEQINVARRVHRIQEPFPDSFEELVTS